MTKSTSGDEIDVEHAKRKSTPNDGKPEFEDSKFRCGMVAHPHRFLGGPAFADAITGALFADALGIGQGCDSDDPDAFLKREAA